MGMGPDKMVTKHMKMMDQDGNEKLSQQEFMDFHNQQFQQMDVNGDGSLDTEEFSMGMRAMRRSMKGGGMSPPAQQMNPQQNHGQPPSQLDVQKSNQGQ